MKKLLSQKKLYKVAKKLIKTNGYVDVTFMESYCIDNNVGYDKDTYIDLLYQLFLSNKLMIDNDKHEHYRYIKHKKRLNGDILDNMYVQFFVSDLILISFLVEYSDFHNGFLELRTMSDKEYYMGDMKFITNTDSVLLAHSYNRNYKVVDETKDVEYIADNISWIFNDFYKLLKNRKYKKLSNMCLENYDDISVDLYNKLYTHLEYKRDLILTNLYTLKHKYKL